jgi:hypothetical protein
MQACKDDGSGRSPLVVKGYQELLGGGIEDDIEGDGTGTIGFSYFIGAPPPFPLTPLIPVLRQMDIRLVNGLRPATIS